MPRAIFNDSFNDIHELKCSQAEEKLEAGGDEKLIFNFIWPKCYFKLNLSLCCRLSIIVSHHCLPKVRLTIFIKRFIMWESSCVHIIVVSKRN